MIGYLLCQIVQSETKDYIKITKLNILDHTAADDDKDLLSIKD
jgi:hypothetical protein